MVELQEPDLVWRQPLVGEGGRVRKQEQTGKAGDDGGDAFENENPPPSLVAASTVHLGDEVRQQARESTRRSAGRVEDGDSGLCLVWRVPLSDNVVCPRKEPGPLSDVSRS